MKNINNVSFWGWFRIFFFEWFIPKASIVLSVWWLSKILFAVDIKFWSDGDAAKYILNLFKYSNNKILPWVTGGIALLILVSFVTPYVKGKIKKIAFYLENKRNILVILVLFLLSVMLIPISFAFFYALHFGIDSLAWFAVTLGFSFIAISMAFHYLPYLETNPTNYIAYQLKPRINYNNITQTIRQIKDKIASELRERKIDFIYEPEIVLNSKDGQGIIIIPLGVKYEEWTDDEKKKLEICLSKIDSLLTDKWEFSRFKSIGIYKKIKIIKKS